MHTDRRLQGIVLRRATTGEADRIITLLTPEGKVTVVARGVRKITSRKSGIFELFHLVEVLLAERSGLPVVREVTLKESFGQLRTDFEATVRAFWAAELIDRLAGVEVAGSLFSILLTYLERLTAGANQLDIRAFELAVLREVGWQPELGRCAHCGHALDPSQFGWSNQLGGVIDSDCLTNQLDARSISVDAVKTLRLLLDQTDAADRLIIPRAIEAEIEEILHHYLESLGERAFRSPELLKIARRAN